MLIRAERDAIKAALAEAETRVREQRANLKAMEDALTVLTGEPLPATSGPRAIFPSRKLKDLAKEIIHSAERGLKTTDILEELDRRERPTDLNSLLSTLSRLKTAKDAYKHADRHWYPYPETADDKVNEQIF